MNESTPSVTKNKSILVVLAAVIAVGFWSLKPVFVTIIGHEAGYGEIFIAASVFSIITSIVIAAVQWKSTAQVIHARRELRSGWINGAISGVFLAAWYVFFYRALSGESKADVTIIAFTWPLIALIAMRIFSPDTARKPTRGEYLLVFLAFIGASAVGISNITSAEGSGSAIIYAVLAALGSGLYLPFAIRSFNSFKDVLDNGPKATFYAISTANIVSLLTVIAAFIITRHNLNFTHFDFKTWFICALIGIGTYLIAEVAWTWAFQEYRSLTLSSLPYLSPAVSVILLFLIFHEPVKLVAWIGLLMILVTNMFLHFKKQKPVEPTLVDEEPASPIK